MAVNKNNPAVIGASGRFGPTMVFRQKGKLTIMANRPTPTEIEPTAKQMNVRFSFMEASAYAVSAIADTPLKAAYQAKAKGNQTAYNVAFKDFLTAPILHKVDTSKYKGAVGDPILCRITDVLAVVAVKLTLYDRDGILVEEGMAVQGSLILDWVYKATVAQSAPLGLIVIQMTDVPNNVYTEEYVVV